MNKHEAAKWKGQRVRLRPAARGPALSRDDEWLVTDVSDDAVRVEHVSRKHVALIGLDGVHSYQSDPGSSAPEQKRGFLLLHVQVEVTGDGSVGVEPLPPPRVGAERPGPLDAETARLADQQYRSLWFAARAAIQHLLVAGDSTEEQVRIGIAHIAAAEPGLLQRMATGTQLVQPVQQSPTRETILHGYRGPYTVNPRFRGALERLVAEDTDLRR